jgi:protein gp37
MAENSNIEWTNHTFNPWSGCTKVSPACDHCYAEVNYSVKMRGVKWGKYGNRIIASDSMWNQPLVWNRKAEAEGVRKRVFCASLADVFRRF